jgi:uncharacterized protein (TIGR02466 family)
MNTFNISDPSGASLGTIQTWFPKLIFRAENVLDSKYLSDLKISTEKLVKQNSVSDTALNVNSTHLVDNLIKYSEYNILSQQILKMAIGFGEALGYCSKTQMENIRIANMWANASTEGDFVFPHVHTASEISGVYYLESPDDAIITFYDNIYNMSKDAVNPTIFNARYTQYPCTENSLLLFKSNMLHGNEKQPPGNKLAISFNIVF